MKRYLVQYREEAFVIQSTSIYEALDWVGELLGHRRGVCITNID